jgi:hypothetical protein
MTGEPALHGLNPPAALGTAAKSLEKLNANRRLWRCLGGEPVMFHGDVKSGDQPKPCWGGGGAE